MAASACLRILLQPARLERPGSDVMNAAGRFLAAQLDSAWAYPKRVTQTSPNTFLLAEPFAAAIAPDFLQPIAGALQRHLFGVGDSGLDLGYVGQGNPGLNLAGVGIIDVREAARCAGNVLPADEMPDVLDHCCLA